MAEPANARERRAHERYHLKRSFDVLNRGTGLALGKVADVSIQGMMLISSKVIQPDTIYQISLLPTSANDDDPKINMGVDCMWVQEREDTGCWAGFKIIDISDDSLEHLHQLIDLFGEPE